MSQAGEKFGLLKHETHITPACPIQKAY